MTPLEISQHYFTLSNDRDLDAIESLFAPDATYSSDATGEYSDREAIMTMMRGFFARYEYLHWTIDAIEEISPATIEVHFHAVFEDRESKMEKSGIEHIIIHDNLIQSIKVRNS